MDYARVRHELGRPSAESHDNRVEPFPGGQDLSTQLPGGIDHYVSTTPDTLAHSVQVIEPGAPITDRLTGEPPRVTSRHHQAVKRLAEGLVTVALSPDGLIEAAYLDRPDWWVRGVQWHPKNLIALDPQRELWRDFVRAAGFEPHRDGRTATVVLNCPPLNILDIPTIARLGETIGELAADPDLVLVVLRGAGDRAFSVGVAVQDHTPDKVASMLDSFHGTIRRLRDLTAVTVAAVQGHCLGGGMELAMACDLMIATEDCPAQPEIEPGCYPPVAAALLPSRIGAGLMLDLALTGRTLTCDEAERLGLATRRVPSGKLAEAVQEFAAQIAAKSAPVLRLAKKAVRAGHDLPFPEALAVTERIYKDELLRLEDLEEGTAAFLAKRRPVWRHR
jgi:cyclohexa-1,5-dienecarbonyl-CoA hydratase